MQSWLGLGSKVVQFLPNSDSGGISYKSHLIEATEAVLDQDSTKCYTSISHQVRMDILNPQLSSTTISCVLLCSVTQLCLTLCNPMDCSLPGSSVHGDSPGKNTEMGLHTLLQGNFPDQRLSPGLPHCRQILDQLSHQLGILTSRSPRILEWVAYLFSIGTS